MILTLVQDFHNYAHKNVIFVKHVHNNGDNNSCIYENSKFLLKSIIKFFDGKIFFFWFCELFKYFASGGDFVGICCIKSSLNGNR